VTLETSAKTSDAAPRNSVLRDSLLYFSSQIGARALNFFYFMILTWYLPTDEFGILNYALSIIVFLDILVDLGLSRLAMREMAKAPEKTGEFIIRLLPYKMLVAMLLYFALLFWVGQTQNNATYRMIFLISALGIFFTSPSMLLENVMQAHHRFALISGAHVALSIVQFAVGGTILLLGGSTVAIAVVFAVTNFVYAGFMLWGVRRMWPRTGWRWEGIAVLRSLPAAFPYLCSALIVLLAIRAEFLVLGRFGSPVDLGVFGMATKIMEAALLLPLALGTVLAPRFAKAHVAQGSALRDLYLSGLEVLFLVAMPAGILAYGLAPVVPVLLAGRDFGQIDQVLRVLFLGYPAACLFLFNTSLLFGAVRQRRPLMLLIVLAALQVSINVMLQSRYGIWGAADSFVIFMALAAVVSTGFIVIIYTGSTGLLRAVMAPLAGIVASVSVLLFVPIAFDPAAIAVALLVYGVTAFAVRQWMPGGARQISFQV